MIKTCKEKAEEYVNWTIAAGAALAPIPVPFMGTAGLVALESGLVYWIARIYGETLTKGEVVVLVNSLGVASLGLKFVAMEALNFIPFAGWAMKSSFASGVV